VIFTALKNAATDCHPDAHACRLKISLVTMDSGTTLPWDLTTEAAKHAIKFDCVAAVCCVSEREELQILQSPHIVTSETHSKFDRKLHSPYHMTVIQNRVNFLSALTSIECPMVSQAADCVHPPRAETTLWPYFVDDTALGETYAGIQEIDSVKSFNEILCGPDMPKRPDGNEDAATASEGSQKLVDSGFENLTAFAAYLSLRQFEQYNGLADGSAQLEDVQRSALGINGYAYGAPVDGGIAASKAETGTTGQVGQLPSPPPIENYEFLSVAIFQVLWSPACIKAMPLLESLASAWPSAQFMSIRADRTGVDAVSRAYAITQFPTIILFRGSDKGGEILRIEGPDRCIALLSAVLAQNVTPRDIFIRSAMEVQEAFVRRFGTDATAVTDLLATPDTETESESVAGLAAFQAALVDDSAEEQGELIWTWDPEYAADYVRIGAYGTMIGLVDDDDDDDDDDPADEVLLAAASWQVQRDGEHDWTTIEDPFCTIQCERQYRMGRLFLEGKITAVGQDEMYEISIDEKKFQIVDDLVSGMTARKGNDYNMHFMRRKGARVKVQGDEKYADKAQQARDRYTFQYQQQQKQRAKEAKEAGRGRDIQGTRGTHSFMEETGVYKWTCKWRHEPSRSGTGDAVGLCSEAAEGFGPYTAPLLGAKGGVSLGLYATGELIFQGNVIAELSTGATRSVADATKPNTGFSAAGDEDGDDDDGEAGSRATSTDMSLLPKCYAGHPFSSDARPIAQCNWCYQYHCHWYCAFCQTAMCNNCYTQKVQEMQAQAEAKLEEASKAEDADGDTEEATGQEPEPEPGPEPEPEPEVAIVDAAGEALKSTKNRKKKLRDLLPPERKLTSKDLCTLFGRNSSVTITLDTDKNGGSLSFEVNGVKLRDTKTGSDTLPNCFQLLSTAQIYPCVCVAPLDEIPPLPESNPPAQIGKVEQGKDGVTATATDVATGSKKVDDDDEDSAKDLEREQQQLISNIAQMCRVPFSEIEELDPSKRSELRRRARQLLKRRVPSVALIIGDDEDAATAQAKVVAETAAAEATSKNNADTVADEITDEEAKKPAPMVVPFVRVTEGLQVELQAIAKDSWSTAKVTRIVKKCEQVVGEEDAGPEPEPEPGPEPEPEPEPETAKEPNVHEDASDTKVKASSHSMRLDLELNDGTVEKDIALARVRALIPAGPIAVKSSVEVWIAGENRWLPATCAEVSAASECATPEDTVATNVIKNQTSNQSADQSAPSSTFAVCYTDGETESSVLSERVRLFRPLLIGHDDAEPEPLVAKPESDTETPNDGNAETSDVPISRIIWMFETPNGWQPHHAEISRQMEEALREGRTEIMLTVNETRYTMKLVKGAGQGGNNGRGSSNNGQSDEGGGPEQEDDDGQKQRLRRHVRGGDGLQAEWEMLSLMYSPPLSMVGNSALSVLEKVWNGGDSLNGQTAGFGFLFLYNLLRGSTRVSVVSSGSLADMYASRRSGGRNDAARFALLLSQLMTDTNKRGLMHSCVNLLARNRHVCVRAPKFKDTRKLRQSPIFNGWTDDNEPHSPVAELFGKLVPFLQRVKRQRGALRYPPSPPYAEMAEMPSVVHIRRSSTFTFGAVASASTSTPSASECATSDVGIVHFCSRLRAALSDTSCSMREAAPVESEEVFRLAKSVRFDLGNFGAPKSLPINVEEINEFESVADAAADDDRLVIVDFYADWCGPCKQVAPIFRQLSARFGPVAVFVKADIDDNEALAHRFSVQKVPTILFLRGGATTEHVQARLEGGGAGLLPQFMQTLQQLAKDKDIERISHWNAVTRGPSLASAMAIQVSGDELQRLALCPLASLQSYVSTSTRQERGLAKVDCKVEALSGVFSHDAASSAVARSMLGRMTQDVDAYATAENARREVHVTGLSDVDLLHFFQTADEGCSSDIDPTGMEAARTSLSLLLRTLKDMRDADSEAISDAIPLLRHAANFVARGSYRSPTTTPLDAASSEEVEGLGRTLFMLKQASRQVPEVSVEFMFGATLSSQGVEDIAKLNPYMTTDTLNLLLRLVGVTMLRTNRVGHANRCIGMCVRLMGLVDSALKTTEESDDYAKRAGACETLVPKMSQASVALASGLLGERHFMKTKTVCEANPGVDEPGVASQAVVRVEYDPRFLIFEFVWNIMLRKKQVLIVNNFCDKLRHGDSQVKQMIMGAGKTTVVAPLLALCLADGESLVLSVVPKALLEMSRKQMRETFATIITKRIYTMTFDRGTTVTSAMYRSLENAKRNRGVVVATPTTLKSIQLVFVETLERLGVHRREGPQSRVQELTFQTHELAKILQTFREGVLLLDEVDMVLHPLKSELNFPIGEKFDLDGAEQGERWSLPTHLIDAIFFVSSGRVTTFEQSGGALEILGRLALAIQEGYAQKALQRLPHVTLLDQQFYHTSLKPLLAEWAYLWLQTQHLHGIERDEAIRYVLEGAVARSDLALKLRIIDTAIADVQVQLGDQSPHSTLTEGHRSALDSGTVAQHDEEDMALMRQNSQGLTPAAEQSLRQQLHALQRARAAALVQSNLMNEIFATEEQLEGHLNGVAHRSLELAKEIAQLQREVEELENPRDDSTDNDTVIWCSYDAFSAGQAGMSGEPVDDEEEGESDGGIGDGSGEDTSSNHSSESVHAIIGVLEEAGMVCKRCSDPHEAIARGRELQKSRRLRCVIFGGGEKTGGCGKSCRRQHHNDGDCLRCGRSWDHHDPRTHACYYPLPTQATRRGSFVVQKPDSTAVEKVDPVEFFSELTASEDMSLIRDVGLLSSERTCLYGGNVAVNESVRLKMWSLGTAVRDSAAAVNEFVDAVPPWPKDDKMQDGQDDTQDEDEEDAGAPLQRVQSLGSVRLEACRNRLAECESEKAQLADNDEEEKKKLHAQSRSKHADLTGSVEAYLGELDRAFTHLHRLQHDSDVLKPAETNTGDTEFYDMDVGPASGRNAAFALAWLASHGVEPPQTKSSAWRAALDASVCAVAAEIESLRQISLAARVMVFIPSPTHKKLLNLTHDWLRTFLPHCLAKVNRVSFGLLNSRECATALHDDPFVPRSRLALAVPFIGKDVPSKSAEFAHPDITVGLTVMAYRYSGLRDGDFSDIVDALAREFTHEIGPARERPSSLRYEEWVHAAGGTVRGVPAPKLSGVPASAQASTKALDAPSRQDLGEREVVQLKFLQKSNQEQMQKLRTMWTTEPLVLHYYLAKFIFPEHMKSQRLKLSASGQSLGGDMLVGRRVGFSGTPSDLLPKELGQCDYETGDDGKMLSTVLDPLICSTELLQDGWSVASLLQCIATSEVFRALIDTGALITGFSNQEVAMELLKRGLPWCDGVVFLDDEDKQQVLVRATGRVVSADQCGVPLERRFAFYDQIRATFLAC
jgi:thioredoxin